LSARAPRHRQRRCRDASRPDPRVHDIKDSTPRQRLATQNAHQGKVGVLCLAPEEGLGVRDKEIRAQHLDAINRFRGV
jgi:crotonyl-CoA reductase